MKNILITGGSGTLSQALSKKLYKKGYHVKHLSTKKYIKNIYPTYYWNVKDNILDLNALYCTDIIIHLAGISIDSKRWNNKHKKNIIESRVNSMDILLKNIKKLSINIDTFILSSGIGYYGYNNIKKIFDEKDINGNDFLSYVSANCELKSESFDSLGIRRIVMRTGIILSKKSKILKTIYYLIKYYLGAKIGSGNQYISWIDIDDLCNIYIHMIENKKLNGIYNAVATEKITNKKFIEIMALILNKPLFLKKIPDFLIKILYGEISSIILNGNYISNKKLLKSGFIFKYPNLYQSLNKIYSD